MDGTLTEPLLDFPLIKAEMGIGERPILESLAQMAPAKRAVAEGILHRYEDQAAATSTLNPGCRELLAFLHGRRITTALITRNRRASVQTVLARHHLRFDVLITREDGPFKPDPAPLLDACRQLGISPAHAWMIGDGEYDVQAAISAGCRPVWVSHGRSRYFNAEPWRTVNDLVELTELLRLCLH